MNPSAAPGSVLVMGAGSVGCWVGGMLARHGVPVDFVGRPRVLAALAREGLTVSDLEDRRDHLAPGALRLHEEVPPRCAPALVLLCVKSGATASAAAELAAALPGGTLVLSLQNGISNADTAARAAPSLQVLPGMVPYNIAELSPGAYHRGTAGRLAAQAHPLLDPWTRVFADADVPLEQVADLRPVQWGKLLLNLNNPVNALSGLPLREQLMQRGYRRCLAALMEEALRVLRAAGIAPAQMAALPPARMPGLLRLPDWLFRLVAARMLRIDPQARSSMADDLALGRRTEVDAFCGEIVRLARHNGMEAPRNARMVALLDGGWPAPPPRLSADALQAALGL